MYLCPTTLSSLLLVVCPACNRIRNASNHPAAVYVKGDCSSLEIDGLHLVSPLGLSVAIWVQLTPTISESWASSAPAGSEILAFLTSMIIVIIAVVKWSAGVSRASGAPS